MSGNSSAQCRAIESLFAKLVEAITPKVSTFIQRARSGDIIDKGAAFKASQADGTKASALVSAIIDKVEQDSTVFEKFLKLLKEFSSLKQIAPLIEYEFATLSKQAGASRQSMAQGQGPSKSHGSMSSPPGSMPKLEPASDTFESGFNDSCQDLGPIAGEQATGSSMGNIPGTRLPEHPVSATVDPLNIPGTNLPESSVFAFSNPPLLIPTGDDCEKQKEDISSPGVNVLNDCEERKEDILPAPTADTQPPGKPLFSVGSVQEVSGESKPGSAVTDLKEAGDRVAEEMSSKDRKISELNKIVIEKDEELKIVKEEKAKLEDELEQKDVEIKQKDIEINNLLEKLLKQEKVIELQRNRLSSAEKENILLRDQCKAKIKRLKEEKDMDVLKCTKEKHALEVQIKNMEVREQRLLTEIANAKKESSDIKAELAYERQKIAEEKRSESETKLEEIKRERDELLRQLSRTSLSSNATNPSLSSQASVQSLPNSQVSMEASLSPQSSVEPK